MGRPRWPVGHIPLVQPHRVKPDKARGQLLLHILETGLEDLSVLWIFEIVGVVLPELYQPAHLRKNFSGLDRVPPRILILILYWQSQIFPSRK